MTVELKHWSDYPAITTARKWSLDALARLTRALTSGEAAHVSPAVRTIAVTGSLARLDACPTSDVDLIVVLNDVDTRSDEAGSDACTEGIDAGDCQSAMQSAIAAAGLQMSMKSGIYTQPTTLNDLADPRTIGQVDEDMGVFGKRMQLLIESRPIWREEAHSEIIRALLERYLNPTTLEFGFHSSDYFFNDLIRYQRSYRVAKQWSFLSGRSGWLLKQIKVRHSRLLTYISMLFLLAEFTSGKARDASWLQQQLSVSPLDRIAATFCRYDKEPTDIFNAYARFLEAMADGEIRQQLESWSPNHVEPNADQSATGAERHPPAAYSRLLANSEAMADAAFAFMNEHFNKHSNSFMQRMVF